MSSIPVVIHFGPSNPLPRSQPYLEYTVPITVPYAGFYPCPHHLGLRVPCYFGTRVFLIRFVATVPSELRGLLGIGVVGGFVATSSDSARRFLTGVDVSDVGVFGLRSAANATA